MPFCGSENSKDGASSFPGQHTPLPSCAKGERVSLSSLRTSLLSAFIHNFSSPHQSLPGSNSLVTFPQVWRAVCEHSQSSARMNHFSLTASSHRASAPDPEGSCGSSVERTPKLDGTLVSLMSAEIRGVITSISLLAVLLNIQPRTFLTFLLPGLSSLPTRTLRAFSAGLLPRQCVPSLDCPES